MGEVIAFKPRVQAAQRPARNGAAEILFFTGVRRQRDEPDTGAPAPKRPSPQENRGGRRRRRG